MKAWWDFGLVGVVAALFALGYFGYLRENAFKIIPLFFEWVGVLFVAGTFCGVFLSRLQNVRREKEIARNR